MFVEIQVRLQAMVLFISSENFAKTQLALGTSLAAIIISPLGNHFAISHCHVDDLFAQQNIDVDQFEFDSPNYYGGMTRILGCYNGLHCILLAQKHFILVNPCTRQVHKLPPLADEEPWIGLYGYGESNGDYKVFTEFRTSSPFAQVSKLYSLKTNSWKTVKGLYFGCFNSRKGVFVNGKLHWVKHIRFSPPSSSEIVTFDLGSEIVGVIECPSLPHEIMCFDRDMTMSVVQGCLCLLRHNFNTNTKDVWVMKEYGVNESWCIVLTFPQDYKSAFEVPVPICTSQEGEVLVNNKRGTFLFYNPKLNSTRHLNINKIGKLYDIGVGIQSLVSPFPRGEQNGAEKSWIRQLGRLVEEFLVF